MSSATQLSASSVVREASFGISVVGLAAACSQDTLRDSHVMDLQRKAGKPFRFLQKRDGSMSLRLLLTIFGKSGLGKLTIRSQGMPPLQAGKTGIVSICGDPFCTALDGKRGQKGIRNEVALGVGFAT